jgi:LysR family transcriptional regulator, glycine cleavage system transcriptional activator
MYIGSSRIPHWTLWIGAHVPKFRLPLLNSLRAFEAAARHQSIKLACAELHVTHAAVSRHVRKLEKQLGRDLFERRHRQIILTEAGEVLLGALTTGFSHIQRALTQLSGKPGLERLVISVDPDFAGLWLVPRLSDFYAIVPDTLVEILAERTTPAFGDSRISCAIHYAEAGHEPEAGEMLFRSRLFPVCAKELMSQGPLDSPDDLRHHVLLHDRSVTEWEEYLRSAAATYEINVRSGIVFSETALCLDAAARGQGVAIGDDFLAANYLAEGRLVKPFRSAVLSKNAYYFLASEAGSTHPSVSAFRHWLFRSVESVRLDE